MGDGGVVCALCCAKSNLEKLSMCDKWTEGTLHLVERVMPGLVTIAVPFCMTPYGKER